MATYKIEATIEKLKWKAKDDLKIQLKGVGKYSFEKDTDKGKDKEYWNIFEKDDIDKSEFKKQPTSVSFKSTNAFESNLISYAFVEKKKLKFELDKTYTITSISHAST